MDFVVARVVAHDAMLGFGGTLLKTASKSRGHLIKRESFEDEAGVTGRFSGSPPTSDHFRCQPERLHPQSTSALARHSESPSCRPIVVIRRTHICSYLWSFQTWVIAANGNQPLYF